MLAGSENVARKKVFQYQGRFGHFQSILDCRRTAGVNRKKPGNNWRWYRRPLHRISSRLLGNNKRKEEGESQQREILKCGFEPHHWLVFTDTYHNYEF